MLEELQELVELHPRNNHNLCLSGGMTEIITMIFTHADKSIRRSACSIFSTAAQNNDEVQKFCSKLGCLNLTQLCDSEEDLALKEALFSSFSSFIKGHNFESKQQFIRDFDGLAFLTKIFINDYALRFRKKILALLMDLVMYDD